MGNKIKKLNEAFESTTDTTVTFIAHIREHDSQIQTVLEHLQGVAQLSQKFASKINLPQFGKLIGLSHDLGKYSSKFQRYIRGVNGLLGLEEKRISDSLVGKIDHASAGAQEIWNAFKANNTPLSLCVAQLLAACVASHHTGLYDFIKQDGDSPFLTRITKSVDEAMSKCDEAISKQIIAILASNNILEELKPILKVIEDTEITPRLRRFHLGQLLRFLFSCLIDADRLDTANFENPESGNFRNTNITTDWNPLTHALETYLGAFKPKNHVDELRNAISNYCLVAATRPRGVFSLTVPTGGGKTLASLRFALHHAQNHSSTATSSIERIIYVIPYTTIIEQNAETVRNILGEDTVLEHHSNIVPEKDTWRSRVLSENWDAPIVFTTSVQFLNALFGSSTRDVRRMHQLANAVIIFDEIQTLPIKTIHLFNNAINFLTRMCNSSVVFCTATQPLLDKVNQELGAIHFNANSNIIPDNAQLFDKLRRTEIKDYRRPEGWCVQNVARLAIEQAKENGSTLIIVNTKNSASALFDELRSNEDIKIYHLSTNMCSAHRKTILAKIRNELSSPTQPIICISTQLIEAGVDIDFGSVIRYLAGLDSIAQAAGRCNRHGRRQTLAPVFVVNSSKENTDRLTDIQKGKEHSERILDDFRKDPESMGNDLLSPQAMNQFYKYYFFDRASEMSYRVSPKTKENPNITSKTDLLDLLSENKDSVESYTRTNKNIRPQLLLRQAFETAYNAFRVIDAPTEGIIVPYGEEGRGIINELISAFNQPECPIATQKKLLRRAQQYSVNLFPNLFLKLEKNGAIREVQKGSAIYYLDERHYNDALGITLEETMEMTFLNV